MKEKKPENMVEFNLLGKDPSLEDVLQFMESDIYLKGDVKLDENAKFRYVRATQIAEEATSWNVTLKVDPAETRKYHSLELTFKDSFVNKEDAGRLANIIELLGDFDMFSSQNGTISIMFGAYLYYQD